MSSLVQPRFIKPMLATLTSDYFASPEWLYEHKFDGIRCIASKQAGQVRLFSRNRRLMNQTYPELVAALQAQTADNFIVDGEIIASGPTGTADFQALQSRINLLDPVKLATERRKIKIAFCIFDLLYLAGHDLRPLPLLSRKKYLKQLLKYNQRLIYTTHRTGDGLKFFQQACKLHWEGLIVKRSASPYVSRRSTDWLKFKCIMQQELVIGGYTAPQGARQHFGALLVGYYQADKFKYAGKVGTGFSQATLQFLAQKMTPLETDHCPFGDPRAVPAGRSQITWLKPKLVAEFQFAEWT
ncbi:MAG TPA: non-homologous end-joining DNA ligase, partial [Candidatus Babeliales bacterium]|nr:non-homologous end-joining DNA ligase [Candidatus Babeliales bacterium]